MLAAGGTGGHLFPALALAEELRRRGWEVDLITDMRGDRYGTDFPARTLYKVPSATLASRSPVAIVKLAVTLLRGVWRATGILRKVRPAALAGFGGYPTFPPAIAARLCRVPVLLHEQNAVMGRANRVLLRFARIFASSFQHTRFVPDSARDKVRFTGNPVRDRVLLAAEKPYTPPEKNGTFELLVFGGSQGARFFSDIVPEAITLLPEDLKKRISVVQQCRQEDLDRVHAVYHDAEIDAELRTFFPDLPDRIASAHLVIARSGASTVAELGVMGRPSILIPYSHALDNDQLENATRLQSERAAWCYPETEFSAAKLSGEIRRLSTSPDLLARTAIAARKCGKPDAVKLLANEVEKLARRGR
jgi:UDP-N-acetylglucosamine--N-acetylmuramyl-(pentapeptide) pyrophosphoryl-undecaprenol N-acetylglucosamine transferase